MNCFLYTLRIRKKIPTVRLFTGTSWDKIITNPHKIINNNNLYARETSNSAMMWKHKYIMNSQDWVSFPQIRLGWRELTLELCWRTLEGRCVWVFDLTLSPPLLSVHLLWNCGLVLLTIMSALFKSITLRGIYILMSVVKSICLLIKL